MDRVYLIFSCLISATTVLSIQQNRAEVVVDLYNEKLNFFDSFLSPVGIYNLKQSFKNISYKKFAYLDRASDPYYSLAVEIISWCIDVTNTIYVPGHSADISSDLLESGDRFASNVYKKLNQMKASFNSIMTNNNHELSTFDGKVNYAKKIIAEALSVINNSTNISYNRENMQAKCKQMLTQRKATTQPPFKFAQPEYTADDLNALLSGCGGSTLFSKKMFSFLPYITFLTFLSI